jgi:hypothetical protein
MSLMGASSSEGLLGDGLRSTALIMAVPEANSLLESAHSFV